MKWLDRIMDFVARKLEEGVEENKKLVLQALGEASEAMTGYQIRQSIQWKSGRSLSMAAIYEAIGSLLTEGLIVRLMLKPRVRYRLAK